MDSVNSMRIKTGILIFLSLFSCSLLKAQSKMTNHNSETKILVLFNTEGGGTYKMAKEIAAGVEKLPGAKAILKQVPRIKPLENEAKQAFGNIPYANINELPEYDGIAFGSAVHFGNMSADMRYFLDQSVGLWTAHKLEGKPATVFMSAGSGAGREGAILSFWNTLAVHGMMIVSPGIMGTSEIDKSIPQGNTVFGASSLAGATGDRPSKGELHIAALQGYALAKAAKGYQLTKTETAPIMAPLTPSSPKVGRIEARLKELNIILPDAPAPVGNYKPFRISGKQVFINQIALKSGKSRTPGNRRD
jgi:NAD(P)H dehydrogenase (quinone)